MSLPLKIIFIPCVFVTTLLIVFIILSIRTLRRERKIKHYKECIVYEVNTRKVELIVANYSKIMDYCPIVVYEDCAERLIRDNIAIGDVIEMDYSAKQQIISYRKVDHKELYESVTVIGKVIKQIDNKSYLLECEDGTRESIYNMGNQYVIGDNLKVIITRPKKNISFYLPCSNKVEVLSKSN